MIGLIQKVLVNLLTETGGQDLVEKIYAAAGIPADKSFRIDTVYDDEEWQRLLAATKETLGASDSELYGLYAKAFGEDALKRFPMWFKMSANSLELLARQPAIHNHFATGICKDEKAREAVNDKFRVIKSDNKLVTYYTSPNKHCELYKALAQWVIDYYQDSAVITETTCMHKGDDACEIHIAWEKLEQPHGREAESRNRSTAPTRSS